MFPGRFTATFMLCTVIAVACWAAIAPAARAASADSSDFGDAPEGIAAYPNGVIGHFPTCLSPGAPGTREADCAPISSAPGPTGYMKHLPSAAGRRYWLGCGAIGIDFEPDGKVNAPGLGISACGAVATDCSSAHPEWSIPMSFDQDECPGDADAGVNSPILIDARCAGVGEVGFSTFNAAGPTTVYLNVLVDMNHDGDWNDNFICGACAYEWAIKNYVLTLPSGCSLHSSPRFNAVQAMQIAYFDASWVRISLTDDPVDDDFPWRGSEGRPEGAYRGGETEDYQAVLFAADPVRPASWGRLKTIYR